MPRPSSPQARDRMLRVRRRDTAPELAIRHLLFARGLRYRVDQPPVASIRRRADLVFPTACVAVYVDGCFWHACPEHGTWPKNNAEFWREKIEANERRDRDTDRQLQAMGWTVIRVWEHEDAHRAAQRIEQLIRMLAMRRSRSYWSNLAGRDVASPGRALLWHGCDRLSLPSAAP